jgi:hypothetical protein
MPEGYLKMKRQFIKDGMTEKAATKKAARIWNSKHKGKQTVGKGRK